MGCDEVILEKISDPGKDTSSNNPLGSEELLKQALQHPQYKLDSQLLELMIRFLDVW